MGEKESKWLEHLKAAESSGRPGSTVNSPMPSEFPMKSTL